MERLKTYFVMIINQTFAPYSEIISFIRSWIIEQLDIYRSFY